MLQPRLTPSLSTGIVYRPVLAAVVASKVLGSDSAPPPVPLLFSLLELSARLTLLFPCPPPLGPCDRPVSGDLLTPYSTFDVVAGLGASTSAVLYSISSTSPAYKVSSKDSIALPIFPLLAPKPASFDRASTNLVSSCCSSRKVF